MHVIHTVISNISCQFMLNQILQEKISAIRNFLHSRGITNHYAAQKPGYRQAKYTKQSKNYPGGNFPTGMPLHRPTNKAKSLSKRFLRDGWCGSTKMVNFQTAPPAFSIGLKPLTIHLAVKHFRHNLLKCR